MGELHVPIEENNGSPKNSTNGREENASYWESRKRSSSFSCVGMDTKSTPQYRTNSLLPQEPPSSLFRSLSNRHSARSLTTQSRKENDRLARYLLGLIVVCRAVFWIVMGTESSTVARSKRVSRQ